MSLESNFLDDAGCSDKGDRTSCRVWDLHAHEPNFWRLVELK
jgi:hypothetical protein